MRLEGRRLQAGMAGDDVRELHAELELLGYRLPENERDQGVFGVVTAAAVAHFQKSHGIWDTAKVDAQTAAALSRAIGEASASTVVMRVPPPPPPPPPRPLPVAESGPVPPAPASRVPVTPVPAEVAQIRLTGGGTPPAEPPSLTRVVTALVAPRDPVDDECRKLLELVRTRCPGLLDERRRPAGEVGPEIPIDPRSGASLYRLVARGVAGLSTEHTDDAGVVVWVSGDDELAVLVDKVRVKSGEGAVAVDIPVRCDRVGDAAVRVRFAVGSTDRPAGMMASTDERPFGPVEVVDVWGEALTAFAWQILLTSSAKLAHAAGRDADGAGLIPVAVRASLAGVAVLTMARHAFDRRETP